MIVYGSGGDLVVVRPEGEQMCPVCERVRPFSLLLRYEYQHCYFVFGLVSSREYYVVCDVCQRGERVRRKEIEPTLERIPIPFMRRYGCLLLIVPPLLLFLGLILAVIIEQMS